MSRRLLVVVLVAAFGASTAAVAMAATKGAGSPTSAVRLHYRNIHLGEFKTAWDLLTPAAKRKLGPYSKWKKGYGDTGQVTVSGLKRKGNTVRFTLTACRAGGRTGTIEEMFSVSWPTKKSRKRWYLSTGFKVKKTSQESVQRCMLPLP
ncbi:hypothetical protein [Paraconexibacter sp.]|uniref:hypothetical protein n=1 Tax=Paraconexibacter sp. TaxID=2949640 RepID=UPI003567AFE3